MTILIASVRMLETGLENGGGDSCDVVIDHLVKGSTIRTLYRGYHWGQNYVPGETAIAHFNQYILQLHSLQLVLQDEDGKPKDERDREKALMITRDLIAMTPPKK